MSEAIGTTAGESLSTIAADEKTHVSLTASVDVRELPEAVRNHLKTQARQTERAFLREVDRLTETTDVGTDTHETIPTTYPWEIETLSAETVVDVGGESPEARRQVFEAARDYEDQFLSEVRSVREQYAE
jgi:hypothetical protein